MAMGDLLTVLASLKAMARCEGSYCRLLRVSVFQRRLNDMIRH